MLTEALMTASQEHNHPFYHYILACQIQGSLTSALQCASGVFGLLYSYSCHYRFTSPSCGNNKFLLDVLLRWMEGQGQGGVGLGSVGHERRNN